MPSPVHVHPGVGHEQPDHVEVALLGRHVNGRDAVLLRAVQVQLSALHQPLHDRRVPLLQGAQEGVRRGSIEVRRGSGGGQEGAQAEMRGLSPRS